MTFDASLRNIFAVSKRLFFCRKWIIPKRWDLSTFFSCSRPLFVTFWSFSLAVLLLLKLYLCILLLFIAATLDWSFTWLWLWLLAESKTWPLSFGAEKLSLENEFEWSEFMDVSALESVFDCKLSCSWSDGWRLSSRSVPSGKESILVVMPIVTVTLSHWKAAVVVVLPTQMTNQKVNNGWMQMFVCGSAEGKFPVGYWKRAIATPVA